MKRFHDTLLAGLAAVVNIKFRENSLPQVALHVRLGGLGIGIAKDTTLSAFISFLHAVEKRDEVCLWYPKQYTLTRKQ